MVDTGRSKATRQALLVLGMHRSGTSALAGVLARLGATSPKTLIAADQHNVKGYLESPAIVDFDDRILTTAGSNWPDWEPFDQHWISSPFAQSFAAEFPGLIESEYDAASLLLIKDPRISRIVPFWLDQLQMIGIEPKAVLTVRDPLEVAASLAKRNHFSTRVSLLIWLRYLLDAELYTRQIPRSWIHYDDLLKDWRGAASRIGTDLGVAWSEHNNIDSEIHEFLSPELHHHASSLSALLEREDVLDWVKSAYSAINDRKMLYTDDAPIRATLDQIRANFDSACEIFRPLVATEFHQAIADLERISGELDYHKRHHERLKKEEALRQSKTLKRRLARGAMRIKEAGLRLAARGVAASGRLLKSPKANTTSDSKSSAKAERTKAEDARRLKDCLGRTPDSFASYVSLCAADKRFRDAGPPPFASSSEANGRNTKSRSPNSQIAVVCHVYYPELWQDLAQQIAHIPVPFDLFVTISEQAGAEALAEQIKRDFEESDVRIVANRGRDILPFVSVLNASALDRYHLVCKLHTKKSPHRKDGDYWRSKLMFGLLGSSENVKDILRGFNADPELGIIVANGEIYEGDKGWRSNRPRCEELAGKIGLNLADFPARFACGSIFWSRGGALKPLRELSLSAATFEVEDGAVDGTTAHAIERLFSIFAMAEGFRVAERSQI
jgi:hypothetical protein